jgi:phosphoglycolate phosphatase
LNNPVSEHAERDIRAIIFDKDGTLFEFENAWMSYCDEMFDHIAGGNEALRHELAAFCGFDPVRRTFQPGSPIVGGSIDSLCAGWAALAPRLDHAGLMKLSAQVIEEMRPEPLCDLTQLVAELRRGGLLLGLITNDLELAARRQLEAENISDGFTFVCGSDSGFRPKPDPDPIHGFCRTTGLAASNVAMVGDSLHDLKAAVACGAGLIVGVLTGPAGRCELSEYADSVLDSVRELPSLLRDLRILRKDERKPPSSRRPTDPRTPARE